MIIINRPLYIEQINKFINKPVIKILTGMRRVGKSTLLRMVREQIQENVPKDNIVYLNFDSFTNLSIRDWQSLSDHLRPLIENKVGKLYFFFDEIQLVEGWERVVNGLQVDFDADIYITGSNSSMLSGDLSTALAGRYVHFEIQPFTFSEFCEIYKSTDLNIDQLFSKYLLIGGMPFLGYFNLEEEAVYKYLNDVYHTVMVKDVLEYYQIRDVDIFHRILNFAVENIGHTFSALSIRNYFRSENRQVSVDTVLNYLDYCQKAYLIKKASRYDTLGKKLLKVEEKFYLTDHGFRQARGFSNQKDIEWVLENIVYIELLARGYEVKIGKVDQQEIDFIAEREGKRAYYQVSYLLESESTRQREFGVYDKIRDHFPKFVLSMDKLDFSQQGIVHRNLIDWLLGTDSGQSK